MEQGTVKSDTCEQDKLASKSSKTATYLPVELHLELDLELDLELHLGT
jgi:hypothetical protein